MRPNDLGAWTATAGAAIALGVLAPSASHAAQADPAAAQIEAFDGQLIDVMKEAKSLGMTGRYHKLEPVVARTFDVPTMIRFAVGPTWSSMTPAQQASLTQAFNRLTVASFAHNFSGMRGKPGLDFGVYSDILVGASNFQP